MPLRHETTNKNIPDTRQISQSDPAAMRENQQHATVKIRSAIRASFMGGQNRNFYRTNSSKKRTADREPEQGNPMSCLIHGGAFCAHSASLLNPQPTTPN